MQLIHGTDPNVLEAIYATQNSRCFVLLFLLTKLAIFKLRTKSKVSVFKHIPITRIFNFRDNNYVSVSSE